MKILLDECIPRRLQKHFTGYECLHAVEAGYGGKKNGALLSAAEADAFQVLITLDRGFEHQQNLDDRTISILILRSKSSKLIHLEPAIPTVTKILSRLEPGSLHWVECQPE